MTPQQQALAAIELHPTPCVLCGHPPKRVAQFVDHARQKIITFTLCRQCVKLTDIEAMVLRALERNRK